MSWTTRAAKNLLPLSQNKSQLGPALKEWLYTGNFCDLEVPSVDCELCDHPDLRYQFEIRNQFNNAALLVGSECINRFGIVATDASGNILSEEESRKKVNRDRRSLIEEARRRRVVNSLVKLAQTDTEFQILSFLDYLQSRGAFTPNQLSLLLWRFETFGIDYSVADFKITIRRGREKSQLLDMEDWKLQRIAPCLSPTQRKLVAERLEF